MIYVSKSQLEQVEYLIHQSIQGNHVLFDVETVRRVAGSPTATITDEVAYEVEPLIERLMTLPTLEQKRAFLDQLDRGTYECVVRTYLNIVENNLYETQEVRH